MEYSLASDEEILQEMARLLDRLRISKQMKESEIAEAVGISRKTLYNFRRGSSSISLRNFIRLFRALGELERLEALFPEEPDYSPMASPVKEPPRRVRDKGRSERDFRWGDDQ